MHLGASCKLPKPYQYLTFFTRIDHGEAPAYQAAESHGRDRDAPELATISTRPCTPASVSQALVYLAYNHCDRSNSAAIATPGSNARGDEYVGACMNYS